MTEHESTTQSKPFGRPKKLTPELIEQARQHLLSFDVSIGTLLPTIEGLALELKISRETVYQWEKEDPDFSDIVKELRSQQAQKLIQNALAGRYNASIAKLILSGKHGYVEQSEVKATVENVTPILGGKAGENITAGILEGQTVEESEEKDGPTQIQG